MDHCTCDSQKALAGLKTVKGQLEGIIRMIENDRYCIDVSKQVLSVIALLKKANNTILRQHMNTCVRDAMGKKDGSEKLDEIMLILDSYVKE